jgi:hypothetical protein
VNAAIVNQRLRNQAVTRTRARTPDDLVAWLGAVQAQEYPFAKWALGLRLPGAATDAQIERAIDDGKILRTHVMRPTWHFVTPADIRWMLELTAPRVHRTMALYTRRAELTAPILTKGTKGFERALRDGQSLTRTELGARLEREGIKAKGVRLALLTIYAELERVICSGPRRNGQLTYALLDERAPQQRTLSRDEALAELTGRYFKSHGPATIRDFVWWSGLTTPDAKRGLEMNEARHEMLDGRTYWTIGPPSTTVPQNSSVHLLPIYDEYLVAYRDRDAVPHSPTKIASATRGPVTFQHALVIAGQVAGTWRTARDKNGLAVDVIPLRRLTRTERRAVTKVAKQYERFVGVPVALSID